MRNSKFLTRISALVLSVFSLATLFVGCQPQENEPTDPKDPSYENINTQQVNGYVVKDGVPYYTIVIPDGAGECLRYAAEELHSIVAECTGGYLPIREEGQYLYTSESKVISLGETSILNGYEHGFDYSVLNNDGFYTYTFDKSLFICGANDRGTLYGVYDYVERFLGVRFIASDCTILPKTDTLPLNEMEICSVPDFAYRGALHRAVNRADADQAFYARSRQSHEFISVDEKYGGTISWYDGVNVAHNTLSYAPKEEYFVTDEQKEENADMYYLKDGKPYDLCWTNGLNEDGTIDESMETSTIKAAIKSLKSFIQDEPNIEFYPFGQEDHRDGFCTCENCVLASNKYSASGVIIRFVNRMVEEVQKWVDESEEYRGKTVKVVMFAYLYSIYAPVDYNAETKKYEVKDESVRPNENVWIRIAPLDQNQYYTLFDVGQTKKTYQTLVQQWGDVTENLMTWIYGANYTNYLMYTPTIQKMRRELMEMKKADFDYVFIQLDHSEFNDVQQIMNAYVYCKMLWDCEQDPYVLRDEFITHYFGVAAETVRGIYQFMDEYYLDMETQSGGAFSTNMSSSLYHPVEYLEYLSDECDRAVGQIQNSALTETEKAELQKRVERVKLSPLYLRVLNGANYYVGDEASYNETKRQFHTLCQKLEVLYIGEVVIYSEWQKKYPYVA